MHRLRPPDPAPLSRRSGHAQKAQGGLRPPHPAPARPRPTASSERVQACWVATGGRHSFQPGEGAQHGGQLIWRGCHIHAGCPSGSRLRPPQLQQGPRRHGQHAPRPGDPCRTRASAPYDQAWARPWGPVGLGTAWVPVGPMGLGTALAPAHLQRSAQCAVQAALRQAVRRPGAPAGGPTLALLVQAAHLWRSLPCPGAAGAGRSLVAPYATLPPQHLLPQRNRPLANF
jgi:hypothetical protein